MRMVPKYDCMVLYVVATVGKCQHCGVPGFHFDLRKDIFYISNYSDRTFVEIPSQTGRIRRRTYQLDELRRVDYFSAVVLTEFQEQCKAAILDYSIQILLSEYRLTTLACIFGPSTQACDIPREGLVLPVLTQSHRVVQHLL